MKAIKKFNNNVILCIDEKGNEVIARGRGIGFNTFPFEVNLADIETTYYDVNQEYFNMIDKIPDEIIKVATDIVDYARSIIDVPISSNVVFTMADHIEFVIKRYKENMNIKLPVIYDLKHLHEQEFKVGMYGIQRIKLFLDVALPDEEASYIALHLLNAQDQSKKSKSLDDQKIIDEVTRIIQEDSGLKIDKEGFNYSRFVTHMQYLLKRGRQHQTIVSENEDMYKVLIGNYPKTYELSETISNYLKEKVKLELTDEEKLYLMLHINRLCTREGCNH